MSPYLSGEREFLTRQQVFDIVASHLLIQGERAGKAKKSPVPGALREFECLYRAPKGRVCAAGKLLADKYYRKTMENVTCTDEPVRHALILSGVNMTRDSYLVDQLQKVHDANSADRIGTLVARLTFLAHDLELNSTVIWEHIRGPV